MNKKILVIAGFFAPTNSIAAIRPTKLAKYLHLEHDCEITVISMLHKERLKDSILQKDLEYIDNFYSFNPNKICFFLTVLNKIFSFIVRVFLFCLRKIIVNTNKSNFYKKIERFFYVYFFYISNLIDFCYAKKVSRRILQKNDYSEYSAIFSTYSPFSSHIIAAKIKEKYPNIYWVADFRDSVWADVYPKKAQKLCTDYLNFVENHCDLITVVSEGVKESLNLKTNIKVNVLFNGFDLMDIKELKEEKNEILTFSYCGQLYKGKRDFSLIYKALKELIDENKIDNEKISIVYMGQSSLDFNEQIQGYDFKNVSDLGMCIREKSLQLQISSDILLLASWNTYDSTGIITGKFYEYLMMQKPIVCSITGNKPNSILKQLITQNNLGFCIEEASTSNDFSLLKDYLLKIYIDFYNGKIDYAPNKDYVDQFNYKNNSTKLMQVIENHV